jgi:hypothetical protein
MLPGEADTAVQLHAFLRGDQAGAEQILRARADAGDWHSARELAERLAQRGDLDGLRAWAGAGNGYVDLLADDRLATGLPGAGDGPDVVIDGGRAAAASARPVPTENLESCAA